MQIKQGKLNKLKFESDNLWITSDTHFYHDNILKYTNRPWNSVKAMNSGLVKNWNATVPKSADVILLGDLAMGGKKCASGLASILRSLNYKNLYLVVGNHDTYVLEDEECLKHITVLPPLIEARVREPDGKKQSIIFCHYPILSWHRMGQGSWNLSGHCHGNLKEHPGLSMDVGIDTHPLHRPYSYNEVKIMMENKEFIQVDHHSKSTTY
jgi:calcineurin-like phosphoesterase family protein